MTDERPVEELIGWVRTRRYGRSRTMERDWWDDGHDAFRKRAEVDDLADWLANTWEGQQLRIEQMRWVVGEDWAVRIQRRDGEDDWLTGPTIRDALIAAVRAVYEGAS